MLLQLESVNSYYGQIQALKDLSMIVHAGEIVALIGANGAGKTTLLNSVSGLIRPRKGRITFDGQDITSLNAAKTVGLGISHVPEHLIRCDFWQRVDATTGTRLDLVNVLVQVVHVAAAGRKP